MNYKETVTFDSMPGAISYLIGKIEALESRFLDVKPQQEPVDRWLNVDELIEFLSDHPAKATVYGWVSRKEIPFHKGAKKLRFLKSEVDRWLDSGKRQSKTELSEKASVFCQTKRIGG